MPRRVLLLLLSGALITSAVGLAPAGAQGAPPQIPEEVQIHDPFEDANYVNDQGARGTTGFQGNRVTPRDAASVSDLGKIWFSNDAENISLHIQTQVKGPATAALFYRLYANAGEGSAGSSTLGCLQITAFMPGAGYVGTPVARVRDLCNVGDPIDGQFEWTDGPEGTGILTITGPRSYSPLFADGGVLTGAFAESRHLTGGAAPVGSLITPQVDNTVAGTDYTISAGGGEPPGEEPPGEEPPGKKPGKKKGCKKGGEKAEKKGCKKKGKKGKGKGPKTPPAKGCAPFVPGERGAEAPLVEVTDAATEEVPVEQAVTLGMSLADVNPGPLPAPFQPTHDVFNIQVKTKNADAGLFALLQFSDRRDYDLDLLHPDGSYAARSRGFNTLAGTQFSTAGHGGEHGTNYEKLLGIRTDNCGGWTMDVSNHMGEGGNLTVKLWLAEPQTDPQAPGEETP